MQTASTDTVHLNVDRLTHWLSERANIATPVTITVLAGGRSNLTYLVEGADGARVVLRRPPEGDLPRGAHDVVREARMLTALQGHIPVPRILATCEDTSVIGVPFFVMEFLDGMILRNPQSVREHTDKATRARVGDSLVDTLVGLHSVDPQHSGLGAVVERRDYLARQLHRWDANWKHTRTREMPDLARAHSWLMENAPEQSRTSIVHGDFRLDNCILDTSGNVLGLLDWELATVGDPMADLGQLLVYWAEESDDFTALADPPTREPGFATRQALAERYLAATGEDQARLKYFVTFNWWKVSCILENVYSRMLEGVMGEVDRTPESFGEQARALAAMALRQTEER